MKLNNLLFLVFMSCTAFLGCAENINSNEASDTLNYRKELDECYFLPLKLAIPESYVVLPFRPDEDMGGYSGFLCGERSTIKDLWQRQEKEPTNAEIYPISACFYVRSSSSVIQNGPSSFSFTDQELRSTLKKQGAISVKISNLHWGEFPVKTVEAAFSPREHIFTAWIGLNVGMEAVTISYLCPKQTSLFAEESAIWNHFIQNSSGIPLEEFVTHAQERLENNQ